LLFKNIQLMVDIKPENILLDKHGNLKLCDFGLSALYRLRGATKLLSSVVGSPPYVAPEICSEQRYQGPPVDIWSCGIVLFVLLVGNTPWDVPKSTSPEFVEYCERDGKIDEGYYWGRFDTEIRGTLNGNYVLTE
jgi:serine/threonine-protein kinase Chk1